MNNLLGSIHKTLFPMKKKTAKKKPIIFILEVPIYRCEVLVSLDASVDDIVTFAKKSGFNEEAIGLLSSMHDDGSCLGLATSFGRKSTYVIRLFDKEGDIRLFGTITHEAYHITSRIMTNAGMCPSYSTEEAYAYLLEFIVSGIHKGIDELKP